jgi:polyphosphate glucokinase
MGKKKKKKKKAPKIVLGVDIGGSGIKGALVDVRRGELAEKRLRIPTPQPATPEAVVGTVAEIVKHFKWKGRLGCTIPARVRRGVVETATNIDDAWIGTDLEKMIGKRIGLRCAVLNDADAAGVAEVRFGAGKGKKGVVLVLTLGTGIGSALFIDGDLVPNTEFGHLRWKGDIIERWAANSVREQNEMSWEAWAERVQDTLDHVEHLLAPDRIIIGGGVSRQKRWQEYAHLLTTHAKLVPAALTNEAGIVGAAWQARK